MLMMLGMTIRRCCCRHAKYGKKLKIPVQQESFRLLLRILVLHGSLSSSSAVAVEKAQAVDGGGVIHDIASKAKEEQLRELLVPRIPSNINRHTAGNFSRDVPWQGVQGGLTSRREGDNWFTWFIN